MTTTGTSSTTDHPGAAAERPARSPRARRASETGQRVAFGVLGAGTLVAAWYLIAITEVAGAGLVPRPDEVVAATWTGFTGADLMFDIRVSLTRVTIGVTLGCLLAMPVGFLLAWYPRIRATVDPLINFFRALPPIALIPLVVVYFGIGEFARISILVYASFFAAIVVLYEGISAIDPIYVRAARALGASSAEVFYRCVIPAAIPHLFTAVRVALGVSWATLVAAELIAATRGLGAAIQDAGNFFRVPDIYVGIILIGIAAVVMDYLLKLIQQRATRWQEKSTR